MPEPSGQQDEGLLSVGDAQQRGAAGQPAQAAQDRLRRYLRDSGPDDATARDRAAAIDAFVLGVSTRRRVLRSELGAPAELQAWLSTTIQRLADP